MKLLFQGIGVLTQYNWALPYYISKKRVKIFNLTSLLSYLMGGHYYHSKALLSLIPIFIKFGVSYSSFFDDYIEKLLYIEKLAKQFDIIHLNDPSSSLTRRLLKIDMPKVFVFHGSLDSIGEAESFITCQRFNEIYSKVNAFVVASNHAARTVERLCGFKPTVIHHGVDINIFNPYSVSKEGSRKKLFIPKDKKVIIWVGRIDPVKNLAMMINALPYIIKERKDVLLIVKGRTVNKTYLRRILTSIQNLGLSQYVRLDIGWSTTLNTIYYYYRAADVYVHTSLSEAFGSLTMLEAMASGTPVVAYRRSSIPEALGEAGFLVDSEQELAEKILNILNDDKLKRIISNKAYNRIAENFTWELAAEKYLRLYNSVHQDL